MGRDRVWRGNRGFTLLEVINSVAILGVLAAVGLPSLVGILNAYRLYISAWQMATDLHRARQGAISTRQPHRVRVVPAGAGPGSTYLLERRQGARWIQTAAPMRMPAGVSIHRASTPATRAIPFAPTGTAAPMGTIRLAGPRGGYEIAVDLVGKVTVRRCGAAAPCPWLGQPA